MNEPMVVSGERYPMPCVPQNIKKSIAAIFMTNVPLLERKLHNVCLYHAFNMDNEPDEYGRFEIAQKELRDFVGYSSNNLEPLKNAFRRLMKTPVEWDLLDEMGRLEEWVSMNLMAEAKIRRGGICTYAFAPTLMEEFRRPDRYQTLDIRVQRNISGEYTQALWECCSRYSDINKTAWFPFHALIKLMGVSPETKQSTSFSEFNRGVLRRAINGVNQQTDLKIEPVYKKLGRRVTDIKFFVERNPQRVLEFGGCYLPPDSKSGPKKSSGANTDEEQSVVSAEDGHLTMEDQTVVLLKEKMGFNEAEAGRMTSKYGVEDIHIFMESAIKKYESGEVRSLKPYFLKVLENQRTERNSEAASRRQQKNDEAEADELAKITKKRAEKAERDQDEAYRLHRDNLIDQIMGEMEVDQYEAVKGEFEKGIADGFVLSAYKKRGLTSPLIRSSFANFMIGKFKGDYPELEKQYYLEHCTE